MYHPGPGASSTKTRIETRRLFVHVRGLGSPGASSTKTRIETAVQIRS